MSNLVVSVTCFKVGIGRVAFASIPFHLTVVCWCFFFWYRLVLLCHKPTRYLKFLIDTLLFPCYIREQGFIMLM